MIKRTNDGSCVWSAMATCLALFGLTPLTLHATDVAAVRTVYVNKYFEIRDREAPTKYVFNGDTRVARVVGSLSANTRIQRLQVYAGWNLCSLAVTATNALAQLSTSSPQPAVQAVYTWNNPSQTYISVSPAETLPAGSVLWLKTITNATLSLTGPYSDPLNLLLSPGGAFAPSAGLETWCITNNLPAGVSVWRYNSFSGHWQAQLAAPLNSQSDFPGFVSPGETVFIQTEATTQLEVPSAALRVRYYHQDHLGSSTLLTDQSGGIVEETAYYPFGYERTTASGGRATENYKFNQREHDRETGNLYMQFRYVNPIQARFLSADPVYGYLQFETHEELANHLLTPQLLNPYSFARNNPIHYSDPSGLQPKPAQPRPAASAPTAQPAKPAAPPPAQSAAPAAQTPAAGPTVVINPDKKVEEQKSAGRTSFQITGTATGFKSRGGVVTEATLPQPKIEIQTTYREGVDPNSTSGYGRGTTKDDKAAGNTTLRFHETQHQRDYQEYIKQHPFPVFQGKVGMSEGEFQKAMKNYKDQVATYRKQMEAESKEKTDCVGDKSSECK